MNSRLDTLQAAVLLVKLKAFQKELADTDAMAEKYAEGLKDCVKVPVIPEGCGSGWAGRRAPGAADRRGEGATEE